MPAQGAHRALHQSLPDRLQLQRSAVPCVSQSALLLVPALGCMACKQAEARSACAGEDEIVLPKTSSSVFISTNIDVRPAA